MRDLESNDVETAARLAAWDAWPDDDDRPTPAELCEDDSRARECDDELCDMDVAEDDG